MNELKINDIKDLVIIPDYSFFIYTFLLIIATLAAIIILFLIVKKFLNRKKTAYELAIINLKNIDLENSKTASYLITKYAKEVLNDDRSKKLYYELLESLENYKYKKEVSKFDKKTLEQFRRFMDSLDV
ncbi:hypothetical protein CRU99_00790 [Malaciobacter mytili]|uniref:DUF4381 domain-containing protein n=1 Tax=Malaciobacter mytili LMG 24559 TaxID=1032238 RepID=A0AAX2AH26_9BACT|nr:hypothetical protein [Malaciobacter mytili]AXH14223.1 hypothetical protein AMYT_0629 [Malaciobacter mytili LMG 24559]RXI48758.1 hypothetical protein CRU99_00790 [Malaciobacter mytili]RXK15333.1 hypothetical protein CP985_09235 [Malaciobacter mytili LMG 24559]